MTSSFGANSAQVSAYPVLVPEWAKQSAVILTWPHRQSDWASRLTEVEPVFAQIVAAIADYETVILNCYDNDHQQQVKTCLQKYSVNFHNVRFYVVPTNDTWVRDYGPLSVLSQNQMKLEKFRFTGWGGKYPANLDDRVTQQLQQANAFGNTPLSYSSIILEGGAIDTDGAGTLLTTERCLLSQSRNPQMHKHDYERLFKTRFGIERTLWIANGELEGDDTDGHIDMLARFCDENTIAYMQCNDKHDFHYASLLKMQQELQNLRTADNRPYRLVALPLPPAKFSSEGRRLPASYANFLIINQAVLVPTYNDPADTLAIAALQTCFPDRRIIGIPCLPIIEQNGSLHCLTMQVADGIIPLT